MTEFHGRDSRQPEPRMWVRPADACRLLGVGLTTLYSWLNSGKLESRLVGRVRLISVRSIEQIGRDDRDQAA